MVARVALSPQRMYTLRTVRYLMAYVICYHIKEKVYKLIQVRHIVSKGALYVHR